VTLANVRNPKLVIAVSVEFALMLQRRHGAFIAGDLAVPDLQSEAIFQDIIWFCAQTNGRLPGQQEIRVPEAGVGRGARLSSRQSRPGGDAGNDGFASHRPGQMFDAYSLQESSWQSVRDPWLAATVSLDMAGRLESGSTMRHQRLSVIVTSMVTRSRHNPSSICG
jgi:hypothetical protein